MRLLRFIHFMLEAVEALLRQEGLLHMNALIGTRRSRGKGKQTVIGDDFLSGCISGNFWDHDASLSWMCFIACWTTVQPILYMFVFSLN